jgi:CheY-like chemotaxis protein
MNPRKCLPFYHPTRVVFVDHDRAFLNLLPLRLGGGLPFLRYDSPRELLRDLQSGRLQGVLDLDWWDVFPADGERQGLEQVVAFDTSLVFMRVFNQARFGLASVVVIDQHMPEMSGLDLCRELAHLPAKRILLTGQTDDALAVHAFNEGLIDLYLPKSHPRLGTELIQAIRRFQFAFLEQGTELVTKVLSASDPVVWGDSSFARFFYRICEDRGAVEYYAVGNPKGFLLVDARGQAELMLLFDEAQLAAQSAAAMASRAPEGVVLQVRTRRSGLYFPYDDSECVLSESQWWDACVSLEPFPGRDDRFYALVGDPRPFMVNPDTVLGLSRYLDFTA